MASSRRRCKAVLLLCLLQWIVGIFYIQYRTLLSGDIFSASLAATARRASHLFKPATLSQGSGADEAIRLQRLDTLHHACHNLFFNVSASDPPHKARLAKYFLIDPVHKLALNAIPKTGSTSWRAALLNNSVPVHVRGHKAITKGQKLRKVHSPSTFRQSDIILATTVSIEELLLSLKTNYTVLTVRHPFDRLESVFIDKVVMFNYCSLREKILQQRNIDQDDVERLAQNGTNVKFEEFIKYTFVASDPHWNSIYYQAFPCSVPYRYIAKTESLDRDLNYIIHHKLSGHGSAIQLNSMRQPIVNKHGRFLPLFSNLKNQAYWISEVLKYHGKDMELFGYSYSIENRKVYATCKRYDEFGACI